MAEGIRIRPRAELNFPDGAMVVVVDHARPFREPADGQRLVDVQPPCSLCSPLDSKGQSVEPFVKHFAKTYHIQLRAGSAIVSTEVWENLLRLRSPTGDNDNPFEMVNTVAAPPAQGISPWTTKPPQLIEKFVMPLRIDRPTLN